MSLLTVLSPHPAFFYSPEIYRHTQEKFKMMDWKKDYRYHNFMPKGAILNIRRRYIFQCNNAFMIRIQKAIECGSNMDPKHGLSALWSLLYWPWFCCHPGVQFDGVITKLYYQVDEIAQTGDPLVDVQVAISWGSAPLQDSRFEFCFNKIVLLIDWLTVWLIVCVRLLGANQRQYNSWTMTLIPGRTRVSGQESEY